MIRAVRSKITDDVQCMSAFVIIDDKIRIKKVPSCMLRLLAQASFYSKDVFSKVKA